MGIRQEIEDTLFRYALAFDEDDMDAFGECFTNDGVIKASGFQISGRDQIRTAFAERRQAYAERGEQPRHFGSNVLVRQHSPTSATVTSYLLVTVASAGTTIRTTGRYTDEMVLDDARWRIRHRTVDADGQ